MKTEWILWLFLCGILAMCIAAATFYVLDTATPGFLRACLIIGFIWMGIDVLHALRSRPPWRIK
jgi:hypothetical protein